jgi:hypothetical protein
LAGVYRCQGNVNKHALRDRLAKVRRTRCRVPTSKGPKKGKTIQTPNLQFLIYDYHPHPTWIPS